jgi:hypothetical protein
VDPEIAHLEDLLDLFRTINTLTRSAVGLRDQVDQQMLAARKREADANALTASPRPKVVEIEKRRKPRR